MHEPRAVVVVHRDVWAYQQAWEQQLAWVQAIHEGQRQDTLILLEHMPVYTLGKRATRADVLRQDIPAVYTDRGGQVTYHGPGQLVVYVLWNLRGQLHGVRAHVARLEEMVMEVLAHYGVVGQRDGAGPGIWVGDAKIASIGVRVTQGVTLHGLSLNRDPDLSHFQGIIPCGQVGRPVTSLAALGVAVSRQALEQRMVEAFERQFNARCWEAS
ncbi:lipoate-protein ligase B [Magnetococcus marinus MC-1]|uniref:Octanoyltransferase n=1 Tax=Magnetococcus marinus (strain ATCC BAA-1437 / JCM 17883 / MC-1) TaxID=156889 RepID=LIPB_MAGMM|nr:lipoyl(octanoyl) transferase LipB [Magnetococcus marinus]A0L510.1 RecName: Full=Octanoyltransferase; AltName: Full=Lipoate-protein ligase B; AltName: Full=Lipoyl/octanoyl transferase; AltName: Full=Octanoyl-[acyl-carrier-protein]-protein N-octanoyltransferase [Magnetococcus marinus MC-1]ABK43053.1 lipoate-protein ligase B [Magnetococcus marinus MC-1]